MATIELDIIKQRSDKLLPEEKLELINYLAASLTPEQKAKASQFDRSLDTGSENFADEDIAAS
jgi:hypothetical protein